MDGFAMESTVVCVFARRFQKPHLVRTTNLYAIPQWTDSLDESNVAPRTSMKVLIFPHAKKGPWLQE